MEHLLALEMIRVTEAAAVQAARLMGRGDKDDADTNNTHTNGFAGASVAGLFLDKFVGEGIDWAHFDTYAWRQAAKPGRPKGGEALGLRAVWHMLQARYG